MRAQAGPRSLAVLGSAVLATTLAPDARSQDWELNPQQAPAPAGAVETHEVLAEPQAPSSGEGVDVELGGQAAYATPPIRGGTNPFGAGFGGRIGLAYRGFYVGATLLDFLGGSDVDVSYRALLYGVELGYGLRLPISGSTRLTLRPVIGLGVASVYYTDPALAVDVVTTASGSATTSGSDTLTVNALYVQPGLVAMLASGAHFVAVGTSLLEIPSIAYGGAAAAEWRSFSTQAQLGFVF